MDVLGNWSLKDLLNPFSEKNPLNPFSQKNLRTAVMLPHYSNPLYWLAPNFYRKTAPTVDGIIVGAVVGYFAGPKAGGAAGGFVSGFESSYLNGGSMSDSLKTGAIGAGIGLLTASIVQGISQSMASSGSNTITVPTGNPTAASIDGVYSDGSTPFVSSGGEAAAAGEGMRQAASLTLTKVSAPIMLEALKVAGGRVTASIWNVALPSVGHMMLTIAGTNLVLSSYFPATHSYHGKLQNRDYSQTMRAEGRPPDQIHQFTLTDPEAAINAGVKEVEKSTWFFLPQLTFGCTTDCVYGATNILVAGGVRIYGYSELPQYFWRAAVPEVNPIYSEYGGFH